MSDDIEKPKKYQMTKLTITAEVHKTLDGNSKNIDTNIAGPSYQTSTNQSNKSGYISFTFL